MDLKSFGYYLIVIIILFSCDQPKVTKPISANEVQTPMAFPFEFIKVRKGEDMDLHLYTCGNQPSLDTLLLFCRSKKEEIKDNRWYEFVFFDSSSNAAFPNLEESAIYSEPKTLKHIKAQFHYCQALSKIGKLTFASPNFLDGEWQEIEIK